MSPYQTNQQANNNHALPFWRLLSLGALYLVVGILCILTASCAGAAEETHLKITVNVVNGTGDDPMIVLWAESRSGFAKTLYWFSKDSEWYPDLNGWDKKRSEGGFASWKDEPGIDAIMGPTISWGGSKTCIIPIKQGKFNFLDGSYRLRIEQCKDKGGHYKTFKLPLDKDFKGGELTETNGYISNLKIEMIKQ